ncbi:MAG: FkbM family methyltransferase, partial [Gillisia sp.]|nr:FkbM family methyltransferase [Gillisia sp.]
DQHIIENKLPAPDCVLMDIEGAEYLALQGMQETLKSIRFLYMEYVPHHLKDVSGISNIDLMKLIVPFFDKAISTNKKIEIDISGSSDKLIEFLDELNSSNTSDDLIFIKTLIQG